MTPPGPSRPTSSARSRAADGASCRAGTRDASRRRRGYSPVQVRSVEEVQRLHRLAARWSSSSSTSSRTAIRPTFRTGETGPTVGTSRATRSAVADGVAFSTAHAEADARAEGLVPAGTATKVTYTGVDLFRPRHRVIGAHRAPADLLYDGFILCFGTDCRTKTGSSRCECMRRCVRGYPGRLVVAGPHLVERLVAH